MLIIPIIVTNLDLIVAVNGGVQPGFKLNERGGVEPTYLVMESGKENRVIDHDELQEMKKTMDVRSSTRKFYVAK